MSDSINTLFQHAKEAMTKHAGSLIPSLCSLVLAVVIAFGNGQRREGVSDTKQADFERRIVLLENDRATRTELHSFNDRLTEIGSDLRKRLDGMETLLIQDLQSRRR